MTALARPAMRVLLLLSVAAPASGIAALARPALGGHKVAASRRRLEQQPVSLAVAFDGGVLAAITPAALGRDAASASVCAGAAWMWVAFWSKLAADGRIQPNLSRKIIHTGSAPLFMLCWPLFSPAPSAPILAGAVPLLQIIRLYRAGRAQPAQPTPVGAAEADDTADLVKAISRCLPLHIFHHAPPPLSPAATQDTLPQERLALRGPRRPLPLHARPARRHCTWVAEPGGRRRNLPDGRWRRRRRHCRAAVRRRGPRPAAAAPLRAALVPRRALAPPWQRHSSPASGASAAGMALSSGPSRRRRASRAAPRLWRAQPRPRSSRLPPVAQSPGPCLLQRAAHLLKGARGPRDPRRAPSARRSDSSASSTPSASPLSPRPRPRPPSS